MEGVKLPVTVLIAARNEAANIERCVRALAPAERVVVLDSDSTDDTALLAARLGAEVVQFRYAGGYPKKRQWALETLPISTPWVLLLDADEIATPELWAEMGEAMGAGRCSAFLIQKQFHFLGRRMRFGGFSHRAVLLFRTGTARFERLVDADGSGLDMEVHERVLVSGALGSLRSPLIHDDFKGLEAYLEKHRRYAVWEAAVRDRFLRTGRFGEDSVAPKAFGNLQERRRFLKKVAMRIPFEPLLWFCYHYFARGGFLEGRRGWLACRIRAEYIGMVRENLRRKIAGPTE